MVVKRISHAGWVRKRLVRPLPPVRPPTRPRLIRSGSPEDRDTLMQALLAEIARGHSVTKLYSLLLVQEIITHDPELASKYRHQLETVQE
jgi:hypothetical protein